MSGIWQFIYAVVKAVIEAFLGKPIKTEETYRDANGSRPADGVFTDDDW